ncbi:hypothetical protein ACQP1U_15625 [Actinomycetota bacterium]
MWETDTRSSDAPSAGGGEAWPGESERTGRFRRRGSGLPAEAEEFVAAQWGPLRTIALAVTADPQRATDIVTDVCVAAARDWDEASEAGQPRDWARRQLVRRLLAEDIPPAAREPVERQAGDLAAYDALSTADRTVLALALLDGQAPETGRALVMSDPAGQGARPLYESWAGRDLTDLREALDTESSRAGGVADPVARVAARVASARRRARRATAAVATALVLGLAWPVAANVRELRPEPAPSSPTSQARRDSSAWQDVSTWPARGNVPAARIDVAKLPESTSVRGRRVIYAQDLPQGRVVVVAGALMVLDPYGDAPEETGPAQSAVEVYGGATGAPADRLTTLGTGMTQPGEAPRVVFAGVLTKGQPCMAFILTPPSHRSAQISTYPEVTNTGSVFRHWDSVPLWGGVWSTALGETAPTWMRVKTVGGDGPAITAEQALSLPGTPVEKASLAQARQTVARGLGVSLEQVPGAVRTDTPIPTRFVDGIVGTSGPIKKALCESST